MALTAAERSLYETRLANAESAYDKLMTGKSTRVFVDQNGERIEYAVANASRLSAYIAELRRLLGKQTITGPMSVWF
jgi:hypothetical protein